MKLLLAAIAFLFLTGCGGSSSSHRSPPAPTPSPSGWVVGPIIDRKNYSQGMPASPTMQGDGWWFDFPQQGGVDAVINTRPPSLVGAKSLTLHYTVTGGGFLASGEDNVPGRVGIMIQRRGDNWSGNGKYQQYRLYGQERPLLVAGDGQLTASVWTDVFGQVVDQSVVDGVLADLDNYAVVFGGSFASHGVFSTKNSQFIFVSMEVQ